MNRGLQVYQNLLQGELHICKYKLFTCVILQLFICVYYRLILSNNKESFNNIQIIAFLYMCKCACLSYISH